MTDCVQCGAEIDGDLFVPEGGGGPMDKDCFIDFITDADSLQSRSDLL